VSDVEDESTVRLESSLVVVQLKMTCSFSRKLEQNGKKEAKHDTNTAAT
jgi:hypothetical protein